MMNRKLPVIFGLALLTLLIPSQAFAEFDVQLPPPLSVTEDGFEPITLPTNQGNIAIATGIDCKVKQTTEWFDQNGRIIDDIDSAGIQGSPFAQLEFTFGLMDDDIQFFQVIPKIFCSENSGLPVEAWLKQMTLTTVANFEGSGQVVDTLHISENRLLQWGSGQGEQEITDQIITSKDLEEHLPDRNLGVNWQFQITGTMNVAYTNFPQIVYQIPILWNELDTIVPTNVLKAPDAPDEPVDTDNDGINDNSDDCDTQPETFNGFEDTDGCPDTKPIECGTGQVIDPTGTFCEQEPVDDPMGLDCESGDLTTNDQITCMNECLSDGNEWKIDTATGKGFCVEPKDPTIIVNGEEPLDPEDFLTGQVIGFGRVIYKDLTQDEFVIESGAFGAGTITPLSVSIVTEGEDKQIERIEYEIFYRFTNTADALATFLVDQDISFVPTVILSSAQSETGTSRIGTSESLGKNAESTNEVGFALSLSKVLFLERDIQVIATQDPDPAIAEGNRAEVTFRIDASGDFTLERENQQADFIIQNNFAEFSPLTIFNQKGAGTGGDFQCPSGQVPIRDADGQQIGCETPTPNDRDADGIPDIEDECPTEFGTATFNGCPPPDPQDDPNDNDGDGTPNDRDTDDDNDGIPDEVDACPKVAGIAQNNGCPSTDPCEDGQQFVVGVEVICVKGDIIFGGNNGEACTLADPENCPEPEIDLNTLLIIGGIIFIIIGVTVAVLRRR